MNINQILFILSTIVLAVAFVIAVGWVDDGNPQEWLVGGLTLFAAGHIAWRCV